VLQLDELQVFSTVGCGSGQRGGLTNGSVVTIDGIPTVRNPIGFSRTAPRYDLAPPQLNADAALVRAWLQHAADDQPLSSSDDAHQKRSA
jgi:hypothetical protein